MYSVPETKLKGDLLLELRDIRLEINKSTADLELINRKRSEAESGFQERERKLIEKEQYIESLQNQIKSL